MLNKKSVGEIIARHAINDKLYETRHYDQSVIVELGLRLRSGEAKAF